MSNILIFAFLIVVIACEIPLVVIAVARTGSPQTRRLRATVSLAVVIIITVLLGVWLLTRSFH